MASFLTELNRAAKIVAREQAQASREAERQQKAAVREAESTRKAFERAAKQVERAEIADRTRLEKGAQEAHVAAMMAEVDRRNLELNGVYEEIDSILAATLDVDDYVDLELLRIEVEHPPFDRPELEIPIPQPESLPDPTKPVFREPPPPTGIFGKKKHAKAVDYAKDRHEGDMKLWNDRLTQLEFDRMSATEDHQRAEKQRLADLTRELERYKKECADRETEAIARNAAVDKLISGLGYGTSEAIQEYVSIVLANSVYPEHFPVTHDFSFEPGSAELRLRVLVPPPALIPDVKAHKYTKTSDQITSTKLSQKACKDRYSGAVQNVALRSIHEVFEADRRGLIQTISLEVGTETLHPATGIDAYIPFVAVASERAAFLEFDLSAVVPSATLDHLGASFSKNPFGLVAADPKGVRRA